MTIDPIAEIHVPRTPTVGRGRSRPTILASRLADAVSLRSGPAAGAPGDRLQQLSKGLVGLQELVTGLQRRISERWSPEAGRELATILEEIDETAESQGFNARGHADYVITDVSKAVESIQILSADVDPKKPLDVTVSVLASAQLGALYLSMGGTNLNLNGNGALASSFTVELSGATGSRTVSFASGTSLTNIAQVFNSLSDYTGVVAEVEENKTAIRLRSEEFGSQEFVSVQVLNDGGIGSADQIGIYEVVQGDPRWPAIAFDSPVAQAGLTDFGTNVEAEVNGSRASTYGLSMAFVHPDITGVITLARDVENVPYQVYEVARPFEAFTLVGVKHAPDTPPGRSGRTPQTDGPPEAHGPPSTPREPEGANLGRRLEVLQTQIAARLSLVDLLKRIPRETHRFTDALGVDPLREAADARRSVLGDPAQSARLFQFDPAAASRAIIR